MSISDEVSAQVLSMVEKSSALEFVSPTTIALGVFEFFRNKKEFEPHLAYASVEHLKQIARRYLTRHHDPAERLQEAIDAGGQSEMFAEELQDRYPVPVGRKEEPRYQLREKMSDDDLLWNAFRLDKVSDATRRHADSLRAVVRLRQAAREVEGEISQ